MNSLSLPVWLHYARTGTVYFPGPGLALRSKMDEEGEVIQVKPLIVVTIKPSRSLVGQMAYLHELFHD
jgi:hypothetical protein